MSRCHHIPSFNSFSGNTRVSFSQKGIILQDNSYYPFGMGLGEAFTHIHNTSSENKYLCNGNLDSDQGPDDFGLGWYEFGARMYDPTIGRWKDVDALAEYYFAVSPYNYALNSPMITIDPNGMGTWQIWNIDEKNAAFGDAGEQKNKKHDDPPSKERDDRTVEKDGIVETYDELLDKFIYINITK